MSIDYCMKCDKRLDTDFVECQPDGTLYCAACLDDMEEARAGAEKESSNAV